LAHLAYIGLMLLYLVTSCTWELHALAVSRGVYAFVHDWQGATYIVADKL
jgi:hypothetical protein